MLSKSVVLVHVSALDQAMLIQKYTQVLRAQCFVRRSSIRKHIEACATSKGKECIACINSPSSATISGDVIKILTLQDQFEKERGFHRRLIVETAYHSHHMEVIYSDYIEALGTVKQRKFEESTRMLSTVSGEEIDSVDLDGTYWARNAVSLVRFSGARSKIFVSDKLQATKTQSNVVVP